MRPDPGARGGGRKRGAPCTRVGSPPVTCVPSSQRGSHRGIVGMATGKCGPTAHPQHVAEAALAESRSPQRCWIWVNIALAQRVPFHASWKPWEELTSHSESGGCQV